MQFGVTNTTQFEKKHHGKQVCKGCGSEGQFVPCGACRYLHYRKNKTVEGYESAKGHMDEFVSAKEDRAFLVDWISCWHDRRVFIFCAFAVQDALEVNQAEVIHTGWVHRDPPNLSLLDACQADTRDSVA